MVRDRLDISIADYVSQCLELAILLEVSAYPKPGNVHRTADFHNTRYEHFLASAIALAPHLRYAANLGVTTYKEEMDLNDIGIGAIIRDAAKSIVRWQHGGNTLLGTMILVLPMAVAAGITFAETSFSTKNLRRNLKLVVEATTPEDAVNLYEAISILKPGGLGRAPKLDVNDPNSKKKLLEEKVTLFEVFKIASSYDSIAFEWVNNYPITFELGYPYLVKQLKETEDINIATVHTFLKILSEVPDTLIARKRGSEEAKKISNEAKKVLEYGGLTTRRGREALRKLDEKLRDPAHQLNPGTTADITAATLAILTLNGYVP